MKRKTVTFKVTRKNDEQTCDKCGKDYSVTFGHTCNGLTRLSDATILTGATNEIKE